jgi:hypothetical protein
MAKASGRTPGTSKIRFIMLEADLSDGDLSQITQAITGALRRSDSAGPRLLIGGTQKRSGATTEETNGDDAVDDVLEVQDVAESRDEAEAATSRKPRKYPSPKVLADVDLKSGDLPFEKFAKEKNPATDLSRFLVAAYWFKANRQLDAVTVDHVFTCYKKMSWGSDIKDFAQPFRDLARAGKGDVKEKRFLINHIGEDAVEKMISES